MPGRYETRSYRTLTRLTATRYDTRSYRSCTTETTYLDGTYPRRANLYDKKHAPRRQNAYRYGASTFQPHFIRTNSEQKCLESKLPRFVRRRRVHRVRARVNRNFVRVVCKQCLYTGPIAPEANVACFGTRRAGLQTGHVRVEQRKGAEGGTL